MRASNEKFTICTHHLSDPPDRQAAIDILERLIAARWRLSQSGRLVHPALDFPLTASFIRDWFHIGWKHAYRIRREALALLDKHGSHHNERTSNIYWIFRLKEPLEKKVFNLLKNQADLKDILLSAEKLLSSIFGDPKEARSP